MTVLMFENITGVNPDFVGTLWNFIVEIVWTRFLIQPWFYLFAFALVVLFFVFSLFGLPDEFKNARY